jgi:hypothetical protein
MYPKHVGHENGGCGHLGGAPLSRPTFGGHSCKKDCMVAPHESVLVQLKKVIFMFTWIHLEGNFSYEICSRESDQKF